jgi:hypothetical protein
MFNIYFPYPLSDLEKSLFSAPVEVTSSVQAPRQWGQRYMNQLGESYSLVRSTAAVSSDIPAGSWVGLTDPMDDPAGGYSIIEGGNNARLIYTLPAHDADKEFMLLVKLAMEASATAGGDPIQPITESDVTNDWVQQTNIETFGKLGWLRHTNWTDWGVGYEWFHFVRNDQYEFDRGDYLIVDRVQQGHVRFGYIVIGVIPAAIYGGEYYSCIAEAHCDGDTTTMGGWLRRHDMPKLLTMPFGLTTIAPNKKNGKNGYNK